MDEAFKSENIRSAMARWERAAGRTGVRYTTILHGPREDLYLTITEYVLADIIHTLSTTRSKIPGWCYASKKYLGESIGVSERSVFSLIKHTKEKGVVESHPEHSNLLRTTELWFNTVEVVREKRRRDAA